MRDFIFGRIRVQLLSEDIVRVEYNGRGEFLDANTLLVANKTAYYNTDPEGCAAENGVKFGEYMLFVPMEAGSLTGMCLAKNGKIIYTYERLKNSGELPAPANTPEAFALSDTPHIILPEGGYAYRGEVRNSGYFIEENAEDVYLLLCGGDAKKLRRLYVELTGRSELVRLSTLGGWNSKYYVYDEESAKRLILDYEKYGVPLDNMVIDTDWRKTRERGIGYDVDETLFPDMARFLSFAHEHVVEIMFNDHPEPVEGADSVLSPQEVKYREEKLTSLMDMGLDMWWYDRNWHTKLKSPASEVNPETWGLYLFGEITKHYYQAKQTREVYRRPVIMGNVDNILNGRYCEIGNSASHRFSIQWTGDISSEPYVISMEVENLLRGGNNCIAYINADCGGHIGNPDKETFLRWMQFGIFSPVFRPHCTNTVERSREPWVYDEETLDIVREYNFMRYRLLPVIYKNAYNNFVTGEPIFKSPGYEYPEDERALSCTDEYMLGNDILISPVGGIPPRLVPAENYTRPVYAVYYGGTKRQGDPLAYGEYPQLNMVLNHKNPAEGVPMYDFSAQFVTKVKFERTVELLLHTDDGATVWIDGEKVVQDDTLHSAVFLNLGTVEAGEHDIRIDYFQAGGEAECALYFSEVREENAAKEIYLPRGRWLDAFGGKIYAGESTVYRICPLKEMPLYVRLGALLPLAYNARNTKEQKWNKLVYDFYPDKEADDRGYLYEDDTETTAYQRGELRKSAFEAKFCAERNAYVVTLFAASGKFAGEKCFSSRDVTLKYHLFEGAENVTKVTVNGEETVFARKEKDTQAYPFGSAAAPDSDVLLVTLSCDTDKDYEIVFYI